MLLSHKWKLGLRVLRFFGPLQKRWQQLQQKPWPVSMRKEKNYSWSIPVASSSTLEEVFVYMYMCLHGSNHGNSIGLVVRRHASKPLHSSGFWFSHLQNGSGNEPCIFQVLVFVECCLLPFSLVLWAWITGDSLSLKSMDSLTIKSKDESLGWTWGALPHQNQMNSCFSKRLQKGPVLITVTPDQQQGNYIFVLWQRGSDRRSPGAEKYRPIWMGTEHKPFPVFVWIHIDTNVDLGAYVSKSFYCWNSHGCEWMFSAMGTTEKWGDW